MNLSQVTWRTSRHSANGADCVEVGVWHKSSHSTGANGCVEVTARGRGSDLLCLVRDSKDREGPVLAFTSDEWRALTARVRNGEFDSLG
ncbi:MAG TPA: DUF397 domain-containing protein [Streptosporangiaceae bacterium]